MKKITFLTIASFVTISLMAQLTWNWNNPKLGYDQVSDVYFTDENDGWATSNMYSNSTYSGIILHTNNGGGQWHKQFTTESSSSIAFFGLYFINSHKGWVVGTGGVLFKTINGGQNWVKSNLPVNADLFNVFFIDENTGWIVGDYEGIFYTTDGGNSWNFTDQGTYDAHSDIFFFNTQVGIAIGLNQDYDKSRILKSTDGGLTWSTKYLFNDDNLNSVFFVNDNQGWAVGDGGIIVQTSDGGESWSAKESNVDWEFWEIGFVNENKGCIAGAEGILCTSDGGNTWAETSVSGYPVSGLCFTNQNKGYAFGMGEGLEDWVAYFTSNNGGETWTNGNAPAASHQVICAINENTLLIGGGNYPYDEIPCIMKTTNNGNSWNYKELSNWYSPIEDMCFVSGIGYAVNSYGYVIKTNDFGNTWELVVQVNWLNDFSRAAVTFSDANSGWIGGESKIGDGRGVIYHTSLGGTTWVKQIDGEFSAVMGILFFNNDKGWAVTARDYEGGNWIPGQILCTENGGNNWTSQNTPGDYGYSGLSFIDDQTGWVCGDVILNTTNGGNSWTLQLDPSVMLNSISFLDENYGYAVGDGGVIYRTSNGGQEWILENKLTVNDLIDVCYVSSNQAWIIGASGLILHASNTISSITEHQNGYTLAKVFPNPGYGRYNIEPSLLHSGLIMVSVTDVNGREILEKKINQNKARPAIIDISDQPDGFYILKLISKSYQETAKLLKY